MSNFVRMFKPQFAALVQAGTKTQTVRPSPKRMPRCGDRLSLRAWCGKPYRSKQRLLREATVTRVVTIRLESPGHQMRVGWTWFDDDQINAFAIADGFRDAHELFAWFEANHGLPFSGIVIFWSGGPP